MNLNSFTDDCLPDRGGEIKEAFNYLENALILDFEGHTVLFDFSQRLKHKRPCTRLSINLEKKTEDELHAKKLT